MKTIATFVSFSSKDFVVARRFFSRLGAQPLSVWDYSSEGEEIPGGEEITPFLKKRIDDSDLFIPLVTANSQDSQYTRAEVAYALAGGKKSRLTIVPLVHKEFAKTAAWNEPFDQLRGLRYYEVDFSSTEEIEKTIHRICHDMGIDYVPLPVEDAKLPFMKKFEDELAQERPDDQERTNSDYHLLQDALISFTSHFEDGDFTQAANSMQFFISTCEYKFKEKQFYYPYIVKAICLMSLGNWTEAQDLLQGLLLRENKDENVFGALGYIKQHQGRYEEAASYYRKALELKPNDSGAASGVLINNVLCGNLGAIEEALAVIENDEADQTERDRIKIDKIKAISFATLGRSEDASAIWQRLVTEGNAESSDAINLSCVMVDLDRPDDGIRILERFLIGHPLALDVLHRLATLCWHTGRHTMAIAHFASLIEKAPNNSQYRFDHLYSLWKSGQEGNSGKASHQFLNMGLPNGADDFYRMGFANWIVGNQERARYDFERSGKPAFEYYSYL